MRDPYDVFLSYYYWVQEQARHRPDQGGQRPKDALVGKPLDDPAVLSFLSDHFGANLQRALEWVQCGRAVIVRYEGLKHDPLAELTVATDAIRPVPEATIARAIETCRAENMRQMGQQKRWQVSDAQLGGTRETLHPAHLAIFRERYAAQIHALGYEVR